MAPQGRAPQDGRPTADLVVRVLGEPSLEHRGRLVHDLMSLPVQRLLARLALAEGQPVSRASLATTMWMDSPESQARTNLRKVLHGVRRRLPDVEEHLEVGQRHVRWRTEGDNDVDLIRFRAALEQGDDRAAAAAYHGDLLPGCHDDWVVEERDRLRVAAAAAVGRLTAAALDRGDDRAALRLAAEHLRLDALTESAHRAVITAHARLGQRAEALRAYHRCAELLDAELGVGPDGQTQALYESLRGRPAETSGAATRRSVQLVGREAELTALRDAWATAQTGRSRLVVLTGEAGIGKSHLARALAEQARATGSVASARAYESAGRLPWGPVVEWLRSPCLAKRIERLAPGWRSELAGLLPELGHELPDRPVESAIERRRQLFDAVGATVSAEPGPLLLLVDDLQWCDSDTLELIGFLVESLPQVPLLVLGTARTDEVGDQHPLSSLIAQLSGHDAVTLIRLENLSQAATAELVHHVGGPVDDDAVDRVWAETGGHPLFVMEAARIGWRPDDAHAVPPSMKAVISARLDRLSGSAQGLVAVAATIGRPFALAELIDASEEPESSVLDGLDELWRRQIVDERAGAYDFRHDRIRHVVDERIGPARRQQLHDAVAHSIRRLHGSGIGPRSSELALHWERAGRLDRAVHACMAAARFAVEVYSLDELVAQCDRGLAMIERLAPGTQRDEQELTLRLLLHGPLGMREGMASPRVQDSVERSITLSRILGRESDAAALRASAMAGIVHSDFDRAERYGRELAARSDDPVARTEGHYLLGVAGFWRGDLDASHANLAAAVASYDPGHGPRHRAYFLQDPKAVCLVRLAVTALWQGHPRQARELVGTAVSFARGIDHPPSTGYVHVYACLVASELGDKEMLRDHLGLGRAIWERHHLRTLEHLGRVFAPWLAALDGDRTAIGRLAEASSSAADDPYVTLHLAYDKSLEGRACLIHGEPDRGLAAAREGLAWAREHSQMYAEALLLRVEGELLAALGDRAVATATLQCAITIADAQGSGHLAQEARAALARLHAGP